MNKPQSIEPKVVQHDPVILQCGAPVIRRLNPQTKDVGLVCPVTHYGLVTMNVGGQTLFGTVTYTTPDGTKCLFAANGGCTWVSTEDLQRFNAGLKVANIPDQNGCTVNGIMALFAAATILVLSQRGCGNDSKLVVPEPNQPAAVDRE